MLLGQIPPRAIPKCVCQSEISVFVREYGNGIHYWLSCRECGKMGQQAIPRHVLSKWERDRAICIDRDESCPDETEDQIFFCSY